MKTLKDVKVGETATVARLHGEGPVKRRIMDMGITKGVQIYVRRPSPSAGSAARTRCGCIWPSWGSWLAAR